MIADTKIDNTPVSTKRGLMQAGSVSVAILTLAKGTLGAGILALPEKAMYSGIPLFLALLMVSGYFTVKSIEMICAGARRSGKYVFEEITESLLGHKMAIVLGVSMLLNCYGASIVFVIAIKGALNSLLLQFGPNWPVYGTLIVGGVVLTPISIVDRINSLRILSLAGVSGVFFTVASAVYALIHLGVSDTLSAPPATSTIVSVMQPQGGFMQIMSLLSTITFAFCNQFNVPQVYDELADKRSQTVSKVAYVSTLLPMGLYILTAITGYLCYGFKIQDNILTNFAPMIDEGVFIIYVGVVAVALSVSLCHLLNNFPMRLSVLFFLPDRYQDNKWIRYSVPLFTAISTIAIAILYEDLSLFLGLVGASTGSVICYIVPAMFSIKDASIEAAASVLPATTIEPKPESKVQSLCKTMMRHPVEVMMLTVGAIIGVIGTFVEIYNCINK